MKRQLNLRQKINLYTSVLFILLLIFMNITVYFLFKNLLLEGEMQEAASEFHNIHQGIISGLKDFPADELLRAYVPLDGALQIVLPDQTAAALVTSTDEKTLQNIVPVYYRETMLNA